MQEANYKNKMKYYSTFFAGASNVIIGFLKKDIDVDIINGFDGLVEYSTREPIERVLKIPYFQNTFAIIKSQHCPINNMLMNLVKDKSITNDIKRVHDFLHLSKHTFRVVISDENSLVSVKDNVLCELENRISMVTRMTVNRRNPDCQFWILHRSEGVSYFSLRCTSLKKNDKERAAGELRPQIAYLLARLSDPQENELFLDPFCGSGAIPIARAKMKKTGLVFATDISESLVHDLKEKVKSIGLKKRIVVKQADALNLHFQDCCIHKIVSDPPWGLYEHIDDINQFYIRMLNEMHRVLICGGLLIILVANNDVFPRVLQKFSDKFKIENQFDVLISGKKASLYKIKKM